MLLVAFRGSSFACWWMKKNNKEKKREREDLQDEANERERASPGKNLLSIIVYFSQYLLVIWLSLLMLLVLLVMLLLKLLKLVFLLFLLLMVRVVLFAGPLAAKLNSPAHFRSQSKSPSPSPSPSLFRPIAGPTIAAATATATAAR